MDQALSTPERAPTMGVLEKLRYSHKDMIDCIIANPGISQGALAARYGYSQAWISNVMASDAWQSALAARRAELVDPTLVATIEERFRGIVHLSQTRVLEALEKPACPVGVALKALEMGAKAIGMGGNNQPPPTAPGQDHLAHLSNRLVDLLGDARKGVTHEGQAERIRVAAQDEEGK